MFCGVCETRRDDEAAKFCVQCAKLMCEECTQHHSHVFLNDTDSRSRDHEVKDLGEILKFFEAESKLQAARSNEDEGAFVCELCDDMSCDRCEARRKRDRRVHRVKKYTPQIQNALAGCQKMIDSKESELRDLLNDVARQESEVVAAMKRTDEMIHQATNEILFRIATALRKRESLLKKTARTPFHDHLQRCRGVAENARSFLRVLHSTRDVVAEHRSADSVPMNKDLFNQLGVLNKLNVSLVHGNTNFNQVLSASMCAKPSDKEVNILCDQILRVVTDHQSRRHGFRNRFSHVVEADDEMSIGETDEDFGEFHVTGNPHWVNKTPKPSTDQQRWAHEPRLAGHHHHQVGGAREKRGGTPNTQHRLHQKSSRDDMLHGKDISTKRTDSGTTSSSGLSHKPGKVAKSAKNHQRKKHVTIENSVRSNSHSEIYNATNASPTSNEPQHVDDLRSQSTGNLAHSTPVAREKEASRPSGHRSRDRRIGDATKKQDRTKSGRPSPEKRHARNLEVETPSNSSALRAPKPKPRNRASRNIDVTSAAAVHDVSWQHSPHLPSFVYFSDLHQQQDVGNTPNGTPRKLSYVPRTLLMGNEFDDRRNRKKSFPIQRPSRIEHVVQDQHSSRTGRVALDNPMLISTPL